MKSGTYLHFNGNCEEAMNFYKDILDGEFSMFMRFSDAPKEVMEVPEFMQKLVMHCTLDFGDTSIFASDYLNEDQPFVAGSNFAVSLNTDDEEQAISVFNSLAEGGTIMMSFMEAFWGGKFGMLQDKFGVQWMLSLNDETHS